MTELNPSENRQTLHLLSEHRMGTVQNNPEIRRFLRAAVTDCGKAIELLDLTQQSEAAGRLHTSGSSCVKSPGKRCADCA